MQGSRGLDTLKERAKELAAPEPSEEHAPPEPEDMGVWDRVTEASTIAPIQGDPSMEPVNNPWEVAMMAGWGDPEEQGRGHDAMMGVDHLLLGEADAMEELRVDGREGGPLTIGAEERRGWTHDVGHGPTERMDWCSHL